MLHRFNRYSLNQYKECLSTQGLVVAICVHTVRTVFALSGDLPCVLQCFWSLPLVETWKSYSKHFQPHVQRLENSDWKRNTKLSA